MNHQTDRELLELAAKAAGLRIKRREDHSFVVWNECDEPWYWNPLMDDGDALRLAVRLRLVIDTDYNNGAAVGSAYLSMDQFHEHDHPSRFGANRATATRRAITRAAAEVAKAGGAA